MFATIIFSGRILYLRSFSYVSLSSQLNASPEAFQITLVTTILCFLNPYTRMGGTELVYNLFAECKPGNTHEGLCIADPGSLAAIWPVVRAIGVAMIVKAALTVVTFGVKLPAGIFIPTLGVGACAGRILGIAMQWFQYRYPDSILLRSCGGDLNCKLFLLSRCY